MWSFWERSFTNRGWHWQSAERGYGGRAAVQPSWSEQSGERLLLCHSLGPHLLPTSTLEAANAIVLLGGFASFVPAGAAGRRQAIALRGMEACLGTTEEGGMLQKFLERCAFPLPASALPAATLWPPKALPMALPMAPKPSPMLPARRPHRKNDGSPKQTSQGCRRGFLQERARRTSWHGTS